MSDPATLSVWLDSDAAAARFTELYGDGSDVLSEQSRRYRTLLQEFLSHYSETGDTAFFSAPGRTEVGGNHTDHNAGRILAAAVDVNILAVAGSNDNSVIRVQSEGYPGDTVDLSDLSVQEHEKYKPAALIRGVCAGMSERGYRVGGFDACVHSTVPVGSGLSSSAAYEVLIVTVLNHLYNDGRVDAIEAAQIAQYAENNHFGKPCGLMDQTTSAVGGIVTIDFRDFDKPLVQNVDFDFAASGFSMMVIDTGGDHADLNDDYAAIENEMKAVAGALGGEVLREFSRDDVLRSVASLRSEAGDRAILRALHFYADDERVVEQVEALEGDDFSRFLSLVVESGESSWMLCQNCYAPGHTDEQGLSIALTVSRHMLQGIGAWRVHGGGFAGTIQAFVPDDLHAEYVGVMQDIFGDGACHELTVRVPGTLKLDTGAGSPEG